MKCCTIQFYSKKDLKLHQKTHNIAIKSASPSSTYTYPVKFTFTPTNNPNNNNDNIIKDLSSLFDENVRLTTPNASANENSKVTGNIIHNSKKPFEKTLKSSKDSSSPSSMNVENDIIH